MDGRTNSISQRDLLCVPRHGFRARIAGREAPIGRALIEMRKTMRLLSGMHSVGAILASAAVAGAQDVDWQKVDAAFGRKANITADAHRYGFPRTDLNVSLDNVIVKPALARSADGLRSSPYTAGSW